jgi:endonuclease/exonuclease/phosphatase family metal-dependent hydrolase
LLRLRPPRSPSVELSADLLDLYNALRGLPVGQRQAVVLHHLVGLPVEEIASQLNVPVGTVKSRLSRGRAALARNYLWADVDLGAGQRLRLIVTHLHSASRGSALQVAQVTRVVQDWGGRPATALFGASARRPPSRSGRG